MNLAYKNRLVLVFFIFISLYSIAIINLYFIQIQNSSFYKNLADNQYKVTIVSTPNRGEIFDRNRKIIAANKDGISCFITPRNLKEKEKTLAFIHKNFPAAYKKFHEKEQEYFMYIKRRLNDKDLKLIKDSELEDLKLLKEPTRYYTCESLSQVIGLTDIDNQGLFGLEKFHNNTLAGSPTTYILEKDARSGQFYFQKEVSLEGTPGQKLITTIDSDLQFIAEQELESCMEQFESKEGQALIMDAQNGDILAMVNKPGFDINDTKDIDLEKTKNKIVTDVHELGSVIKIFLALAALDENVVQEEELIDCEGKKTTFVDHIKVNTWKAFGILSFKEVIHKSNNIGVVKVAKRLGPKLYDHYIKSGFGQKTGVDFQGEQSGFVNPPHNWSKQSLFSLSYGYEITSSILQLARAVAMISNGGYLIRPRIILSDKQPQKIGPIYSETSLNRIRQIIEKPGIEDYKIFGKTGTANLLINGEYDRDRNTYTFSGTIEKDDDKKVIVLYIKESNKKDIYAATVAEPFFRNIAQQIVIKKKLEK